MSDHVPVPAATTPAGQAPDAHGGGHHINYVKIWAILVALLCVSVAGPMLGIFWLTMVTAFGIACVKAYLVAKNFMHVNLEKRFVALMLFTMLALMLVFYGGVSPDVMKHEGTNWNNTAAKDETARQLAKQAAGHGAPAAPEKH